MTWDDGPVRGVLPAFVAVAGAFGEATGAVLFPEERAYVAGAAATRRREFGEVRHCARRALGALGVRPLPLVPGADRAPRWPGGVVGSMTHCPGYRAAAVASRTRLLALGIDAEPHEPLPAGVLDLVADPVERPALARLARTHPRIHWDTLLFSAKESVFKAWFPLMGSWLDFTDARLHFRPRDAAFDVRVRVPASPLPGKSAITPCFIGSWRIARGILATSVTASHSGLAAEGSDGSELSAQPVPTSAYCTPVASSRLRNLSR
ncbi:4'-phosphopantetheinyl transferase superfamily protein [Streptomyces sp. AcE210]|uniref:4'-phosphopantetheinyl transferase family protein n=1 Tax=Streptomyces sp. AcE210 TaxID=2292703 RepID=UPI000E3054F4|nr:4'-phosphopantetheinyl transferase superfamily protein [Streptomyces sp. AcE210]RFC72176.1 4'-phosphopantetheinyl transferase [Streptomyces sp. AcE210]